MAVLEAEKLMAKKEETKRNDVTVRVGAEEVRLAKIVAAYRDQSLAEYLTALVAQHVHDDLKAEQANASKPKRR